MRLALAILLLSFAPPANAAGYGGGFPGGLPPASAFTDLDEPAEPGAPAATAAPAPRPTMAPSPQFRPLAETAPKPVPEAPADPVPAAKEPIAPEIPFHYLRGWHAAGVFDVTLQPIQDPFFDKLKEQLDHGPSIFDQVHDKYVEKAFTLQSVREASR